jgi:putative chitinase
MIGGKVPENEREKVAGATGEPGGGGTAGGEKVSGGAGVGSGLAAVGLKEGSTTSTNQNKELFQKAMNDSKIQDPQTRAAMAAVAEGESGFKMGAEKSYAGTSNDRIRSIFKSKTSKMNDAELTELKKNPEKFFNHVYGGQLGNAKDEGYKFRGRGFIQLTGKGNYEKYGKMAGVDLVKNPELLDDPAIAARVSVEYMKDRTKKGGGDIYDRVARGVGNPVASTEAVKKQAFARNMQSGTFAAGREANLEGIQMAAADPNYGSKLAGINAKMQGATPSKGAVLAESSKKDMVAERDSKTAVSSNQSPAETKKVPGSDDTGGKFGKNQVGNVEPVDARERFKMLFGMVA